MKVFSISCLLFFVSGVFGQTRVHLQSQSTPSTRPFVTGTALPVQCDLGDAFFKADAAPGENLHLCVGSTWVPISGVTSGAGGGSYTPGLGLLLNGSAFAVDFSILPGLATSNAYSNLNDFAGGQIRVQNGTGIPPSAQCGSALHVGKLYARSDAKSANATFYVCSQVADGTYAWEALQAGSAGSQSSGGSAATMIHFRLAFHESSGWRKSSDVGTSTDVAFTGTYGGSASFPASGAPSVEIRNLPLTGSWGGSLKLMLSLGNDQGGSGNVRISARVKCLAHGANYTSPAFASPASGDVATTGQTFQFLTLDLNASACSPGQYVDIEISRDNSIGSNYANPVFIPSVTLVQ